MELFGFPKAQNLLMMKLTGIAMNVEIAWAQYDLVRRPVESSNTVSGRPMGVVGFISKVMHVSDTANASAPVARKGKNPRSHERPCTPRKVHERLSW